MQSIYILVAVLIGLLWLIVISIMLWRISEHYNKLVESTNRKTLTAILEALVSDLHSAKKDIAFLQKQCDTIIKDGSYHIQKIGLVRFNPFKDTGGDQSFILSLIDSHDTGIIISGLYSRAGTRWYAKRIVNGKGIEHELSDEEKKALSESKSISKFS